MRLTLKLSFYQVSYEPKMVIQLEIKPFIELWLIRKVFIQNLKEERTSNSPMVF